MMTGTKNGLQGARILVLEDDYYLAMDLQDALEAAGATVIGPFGDEAEADLAVAESSPDCAFIDVNLGSGPSFTVPASLADRDVPFAFVTGYDADTIPDRFAGVPRFEKPVDAGKVLAMAGTLLRRALPSERAPVWSPPADRPGGDRPG